MPHKLILALLGGAMSLAIPTAASAAEMLHFAISGGYAASFDLDASPVPDYTSSTDFHFYDVSGSFAGLNVNLTRPATATQATSIDFYNSSYGGGIGISADGLERFVADGAQLFTGTTAAPTFVPGVYTLTPSRSYAPSVLTVTSVAAAVPESSTWALMIGGLGLVGGGLRRARRRQATGRGQSVAA